MDQLHRTAPGGFAGGDPGTHQSAKVALLWDESFLWGLIAHAAFLELGVNFDLVTGAEIRSGVLADFDVLFVPGGWASNKIKALEEDGAKAVRRFVAGGGGYVGFCGGAGLALRHRDGLALVPVARKSSGERVPSFSGKIRLRLGGSSHVVWAGVPEDAGFYAWWPGQFEIAEGDGVAILASYGEPEAGSYVADLPVDPLIDWDMWERQYETNLDPERLRGEPAVIEARYGDGRVLLSYPHFETPGDPLGHKVLLNMLGYAAGKSIVTPGGIPPREAGAESARAAAASPSSVVLEIADKLEADAADLIAFGAKNFLWYWRHPWVLQWRRGVRGIEYCTLYIMLKELAACVRAAGATDRPGGIQPALDAELSAIQELALPFFEAAKRLLLMERCAMSRGPLSPLTTDDEDIRRMREELFSGAKSFGGSYKRLIDRIDTAVLRLLKEKERVSGPLL